MRNGMNRRKALFTLLGFVASPALAQARKAGDSPWRVGFLNAGSPESSNYLLEALKRGLRELGYIEGKNVSYVVRWAQGYVDRLPKLASELLDSRVDVIVTAGPPQVRAVGEATKTLPIVMASGADPVAMGFAASLSRPGGNITGLTNLATETAGKLVQFAHEIVPSANKVALLMSGSPSMKDNLIDAQRAGRQLGLELVGVTAKSPDEIEGAFTKLAAEKAELLVVFTDSFLFSQRKAIVELAARRKLPAVYTRGEFVREGGLISYGINLADAFRRSAVFVDKIFKGANPGELPFEQPTRFETVVNLKTASLLRIRLPQSILLRADEVIQ
jgi:putative ABC transport system substrate-binding protein